MKLGVQASAEEGALSLRLAWLTALRLLVLTIFLALTTTIYLRSTPGSWSYRFALVTLAAGYTIAAVYAVLLRRGRHLTKVAFAQLVTDQITWSALVYVSGGVGSGATSLYGLTCLSGAILLGVRGGAVAAVTGALALVALSSGFVFDVIAPPPDQPLDAYATRAADVGYPLLANLLGICVVAILAGYLAERLRTTGGQLETARARAEQAERLAALGRLAAGLAHEIRNPLGSIAGSIELLRTGGTLSAEDQQLCEIIEREARRLNDLVGDMLDLTRARAVDKEPMDLANIARDVVTLAGKIGRGSDVRVTYEGDPTAFVLADAAQMRQVVWNLVRNAIQASSAGDEVRVSVAKTDAGVALEVKDHGAGIAQETKERLFDAFFTTRSHGIGIGLAVVKRVIDEHGFVIEVESAEGVGTTFRVLCEPVEAPQSTRAGVEATG